MREMDSMQKAAIENSLKNSAARLAAAESADVEGEARVDTLETGV